MSTVNSNAAALFNFFTSEGGMSPEDASALVGNFIAESTLDPNALNKKGGGKGAYGIAQWRGDRQDNLRAFAEKNGAAANDLMTQAQFALHELDTYESASRKALMQGKTPEEKAILFEQAYERSKHTESYPTRRRHAANVYRNMMSNVSAPVGEGPEEQRLAAIGAGQQPVVEGGAAQIADGPGSRVPAGDPVTGGDFFDRILDMIGVPPDEVVDEDAPARTMPEVTRRQRIGDLLMGLGTGLGQMSRGAPIDIGATMDRARRTRIAQFNAETQAAAVSKKAAKKAAEYTPAMGANVAKMASKAGIPAEVAALAISGKEGMNTVLKMVQEKYKPRDGKSQMSVEERDGLATALGAMTNANGDPLYSDEELAAIRTSPTVAEEAAAALSPEGMRQRRLAEEAATGFFTDESREKTASMLEGTGDPYDERVAAAVRSGTITRDEFADYMVGDIEAKRDFANSLTLSEEQTEQDLRIENARQANRMALQNDAQSFDQQFAQFQQSLSIQERDAFNALDRDQAIKLAADQDAVTRQQWKRQAATLEGTNPELAQYVRAFGPEVGGSLYQNEQKQELETRKFEAEQALETDKVASIDNAKEALARLYPQFGDAIRSVEDLDTLEEVMRNVRDVEVPREGQLANFVVENPELEPLVRSFASLSAKGVEPLDEELYKAYVKQLTAGYEKAERMSYIGDLMEPIYDSARGFRTEDLATKFGTGQLKSRVLAPLQALGDELGIDFNVLDDNQKINQTMVEQAYARLFQYFREPGSGPLSDYESRILGKASVDPGDTGLRILVSAQMLTREARRKRAMEGMRSDWIKQHRNSPEMLTNEVAFYNYANEKLNATDAFPPGIRIYSDNPEARYSREDLNEHHSTGLLRRGEVFIVEQQNADGEPTYVMKRYGF